MRRDFIFFLDWPGHGTEGNHQFKGGTAYRPFRPTFSQQATEERLCQQASTTLML